MANVKSTGRSQSAGSGDWRGPQEGDPKPVIYFGGRASGSLLPPEGAAEWVGQRPEDPKPIVYFSGIRSFKGYGGEEALHTATGWQHRCFSYAYVGEGSEQYMKQSFEAMRYCLDNEVKVFLDSGAFSFFNTLAKLGRDEKYIRKYIRRYAEWVYQMGPQAFDFYVNFDYIQKCPVIYQVLKDLQELGLRPVPVYHGDSSIDWFQRYIDEGHKLIGLGTMRTRRVSHREKRRFFDMCFNVAAKHGVALHGFAVTGQNMFRYPWYSVDSTSWVIAAVNGQIITIDTARKSVVNLHVSVEKGGATPRNLMGSATLDLGEDVMRGLKKDALVRGFKWEDLQQSAYYRAVYNVRRFMDAATKIDNTKGARNKWQNII